MDLLRNIKQLPWNISTFLTLLPFIFFPFLIFSIEESSFLFWSGLILTLDLFDGLTARILKQENYTRRLVDTIKDKIIFFVTLFILFYNNFIPAFIFWWVLAYFFVLLIGGYFSFRYFQYAPASNNLGRISILILLLLVAYHYLVNCPNKIFEMNSTLNIILISLTLVLNILTIINYCFKILNKKPSS